MIPDVCVTYGDAIEACFPGYGADTTSQCTTYHALYGDNYGDACVTAFEEWLTCLSALSCDELQMKMLPGCEEETTAVDRACVAK